MNSNGGIRDDDSIVEMETTDVDLETRDVDIETITDSLWPGDMPGPRIQDISPTSGTIITIPLEEFQIVHSIEEMRNNIARAQRTEELPSAKYGKISVRQAPKNSAARCRKKLTRLQPKHTAVDNSVRCDSSTAMSATTTVRSTALARRTYTRNPAIDKEGSYHHYLHRKIMQLKSIITACAQNLDLELRQIKLTTDSYILELYTEITKLKSKEDLNADDLDNKIMLLWSKMQSYDGDLYNRFERLHSKMNSYAHDLDQKITSLNSKIAPYAHDLAMQITLMNSKTNSCAIALGEKFKTLHSRCKSGRGFILRQFEKMIYV